MSISRFNQRKCTNLSFKQLILLDGSESDNDMCNFDISNALQIIGIQIGGLRADDSDNLIFGCALRAPNSHRCPSSTYRHLL
jgi:hypothetical protein